MSEIYDMPGHLIRRMQQLSTSVFSQRMKAMGVNLTAHQFAALSMLHSRPGVDQATLGGLIAYDQPTIGGVVSRMIDKGLVQRTTSPTDRRAKVLKLTPEGETLFNMLKPEIAKIQRDILPGLADDEREEFIRLAKKVADTGNLKSRAPLVRAPE